jgi:hypothetical protein
MFTVTYRYSDINQHDARYNLARDYPGGIEILAKRMCMSVAVLRNKLAPGIKTHHINDEEDSLIIEYCQEANVPDPLRGLIAKNYRHGLIAFPMPSVDHMDDSSLTELLCRTMKECADVMASASKAIQDKRITQQEIEDLEKEVQEALAAIVELRERYRTRAAGDPPARA